jgi:Tol biopolymer transport system component
MPACKKFLVTVTVYSIFISCQKHEYESIPGSECNVVQITKNLNPHKIFSPDKSKYLVNKQDAAGVYQVYVGNAGSENMTCISLNHPVGILRAWKDRNKMQVQWHPSGKFIVCAVEKEFYQELLYTPYDLRLGILETGTWMDIWAVTPDGNNWYNLAATEHGFTGPAFTPDGSKAVWAEALNNANLAVDIFGKWKLQLANFTINNGLPSLSNRIDISPQGSRWLEPGNFAPDGRSLLLNSDIGMTNAEGQDQYILDIATGQITNLTNSPKIWDEHGVFSPDGNKILFMSSYPYRADTNSYHTLSIKTEFMIMNKDGSDLRQLTHFRASGYPESGSGIAAVGSWSDDGSTIYVLSLVFPNYEYWILKFNGTCGK